MTPDKFLRDYYGIEADTWKTWRKNWYTNKIMRKAYMGKPRNETVG